MRLHEGEAPLQAMVAAGWNGVVDGIGLEVEAVHLALLARERHHVALVQRGGSVFDEERGEELEVATAGAKDPFAVGLPLPHGFARQGEVGSIGSR